MSRSGIPGGGEQSTRSHADPHVDPQAMPVELHAPWAGEVGPLPPHSRPANSRVRALGKVSAQHRGPALRMLLIPGQLVQGEGGGQLGGLGRIGRENQAFSGQKICMRNPLPHNPV